MLTAVAILILGAAQDDAALAKEVETWSDGRLAGAYYLERTRAGIAIAKDHLRGPIPPQNRPQFQAMEATKKALEEIFARHDPKKPDDTVVRLVTSSDPLIFKGGLETLAAGEFPAALAEITKINPAAARQVQDEQARLKVRRPPRPAEEVRARLIETLKATLADMKRIPQSAKGEQYFRASTTVYYGDDMKAWEAWLTQNERFLGVLPQFRQSVTGDGVLFLDEEARAAGLPWTEWQALGADDRAQKLNDPKLPQDWKRVQISIDLRSRSEIASAYGLQPLQGGEMDVSSAQLAYWVLWHQRLVAREAPGWGLRVLVRGESEWARKTVARCEKLGVKAKTGVDPKR